MDPRLSSTVSNGDIVPELTAVVLQGGSGFLYWAVVFFVLAILAAVVGASGVAGVTMTVAKWFVIIFLILAAVSVLL